MDDLTLLESFRAERAEPDAQARAEIWRALEDRFDSASAVPDAVAAPAPVRIRARRRRHLLRHRRFVAFAGATAAAATIAGILVLGSGPTAQPAAAEILHETAAAAVSPRGAAPVVVPGPGQLLFTKLKRLELQGWIPDCDPLGDRPCGLMGGTMSGADAFNALMPMTQEDWLGEGGVGRLRQVAGAPRFLTEEERSRWEAAGSPLPAPFDPGYQEKVAEAQGEEPLPPGYVSRTRQAGRGVYDTETEVDLAQLQGKGFRFPDTSQLPTDAAALRSAVESNRIPVRGFNLMYPSAKRLDSDQTTAQLLNILQEGSISMTPRLRAALFNALAELPGIEVNPDATDSLGRHGYAIQARGTEYVIDPDTAELLAQREFLTKPGQSAFLEGLPAGFTIRETAYLESGIVDSTNETAAEAEAGEPVATTGPSYRK
ncbi:MAG TPA: hypothetical protein VFJ57_07900 [Solirubrobacterales bacterium]|nr:hypothetical protein [Solirubrobacterales bacterium]